MKAKSVLAFLLFFAIRAVAQHGGDQTEAKCQFSDGRKITLSCSSECKAYRLMTDGDLVTIKGITVPAGDYIVVRRWESPNQWDLIIRKQAERSHSLDLPPLPMSAAPSTSAVGNSAISFDQTGGSCLMHWYSEKSNFLLSVEFTEKNTDLPVTP